MTRLAVCLLVLLMALVSPARAQVFDTVTSEDVAIAFYKVAGLKPSFGAWAKDTQAYHEAPFALRDQIQAQEADRLLKAYDKFSPAIDTLNLATTAIVILVEKPMPRSKNQKQYLLSWSFATDTAEYFPYEYRGMAFALVPQKVKAFQEAEITAAQYAQIKEKIPAGVPVRLILQLRAQYADARQPIKIYDQDVWALVAQVAGVSIWDESGALAWEKTISGYTSPVTGELDKPGGIEKPFP